MLDAKLSEELIKQVGQAEYDKFKDSLSESFNEAMHTGYSVTRVFYNNISGTINISRVDNPRSWNVNNKEKNCD